MHCAHGSLYQWMYYRLEETAMFQTGLVSVSFRQLSPEEVVRAAVAAGLYNIEWGSDVHAPCADTARLQQIRQLQQSYGVKCCSYGTYFYLSTSPMEELPGYIQAAKVLGTDILRVWTGNKSPWKYTEEEKQALYARSREAARLAEDAGVILCLECHRNTYTETKEHTLELMEAVNSPAFRIYWQPHEYFTVEENVQYIQLLKDYIYHIHTYQCKGTQKLPLADGIDEWKTYLQEFRRNHYMLLEFMPDGKVETLPREADTLRSIIGE